jgi:hypothetical protein
MHSIAGREKDLMSCQGFEREGKLTTAEKWFKKCLNIAHVAVPKENQV